jgi:hypothetical protein
MLVLSGLFGAALLLVLLRMLLVITDISRGVARLSDRAEEREQRSLAAAASALQKIIEAGEKIETLERKIRDYDPGAKP